eukprot:CAMPEP_0175065260 /NCGR_PEP_ID=MMETSP0052_2-20121109/15818_1 /TAXON_ID=51329 ORGANISM="Polytomella parva, Strain SAG 63-3" /NCGR_SAMPLE_ID=MMETSP0052_2 /ASSEMBLY_ACC=CAM_ASM_000194 /LENGTH=42 /DNA_ID= /DNA_START= /DNA_END= /DNA_ORIENTATION=
MAQANDFFPTLIIMDLRSKRGERLGEKGEVEGSGMGWKGREE